MIDRFSSPVILMCPPEFYAVSGPDEHGAFANEFARQCYADFMADPRGFQKKAMAQWMAYKQNLQTAGAQILELPPVEDLGDLVFTADASLSLNTPDILTKHPGGLTLTSRFTNHRRHREVDVNLSFLRHALPDRHFVQMDYAFEGTGDNYYDPYRNIFWSGYHAANASHSGVSGVDMSQGRSDLRAHKDLAGHTGCDVVSIAVQSPFYHVDTCLAALPKGHLVVYEGGMDAASFALMKDRAFAPYDLDLDDYLITISRQDAFAFACNIRYVGHVLFTPLISDDLQSRLRAAGYDVVCQDLTAFMADGGATHCLTNTLTEGL